MKKKLPFIALICLPLLISLRFANTALNATEQQIVGSWKIDKIIKGEKTEKGRKVLTFSEDRTFISVKDNGSTMNGEWKVNETTMQLHMDAKDIENEAEAISITKITDRKMELMDGKMTVKLSRVK